MRREDGSEREMKNRNNDQTREEKMEAKERYMIHRKNDREI